MNLLQSRRNRSFRRSNVFALRPVVMPLEARRLMAVGTVHEIPLAAGNSNPAELIQGPDGNLWFLSGTAATTGIIPTYAPQINRITPDGKLTSFSIPRSPEFFGSEYSAAVSGPGGDLWFLDRSSRAVLQVAPDSAFKQIELSQTSGTQIDSIAAGSDGNLWFSFDGASSPTAGVGRITPDDQITRFALPDAAGTVASLVLASDGNLWFLDHGTSKVGMITPTGQVTELASPTPVDNLLAAADGALWYVASGVQPDAPATEGLVRLVPGQQPQIYAAPNLLPMAATTTDPYDPGLLAVPPARLTAATDGSIWFLTSGSESGTTQLARIAATGPITSYAIANITPGSLTAGPAGGINFLLAPNAGQDQSLGQITSAGVITTVDLGQAHPINSLTYSADGNLWFLEAEDNLVGRVDLVASPDPTPQLVGQSIPYASTDQQTDLTINLATVRSLASVHITTTSIDWGDGSTPTPGRLTAQELPIPNDQISATTIAGEHTYATAGYYQVILTVSATDPSGAPLLLRLETSIAVGDPSIPPPSVPVGSDPVPPPNGPPGTLEPPVAPIGILDPTPILTLPITSTPSEPQETPLFIDEPVVVIGPGPLYAPPTVVRNLPEVSSAAATETGVLLATTGVVPATPLGLATFATGALTATSTEFAATIDWGDGSITTPGMIRPQASATGNGQFSVLGSHAFATAGQYMVTIRVAGNDGSLLQVTNTIQVSSPALAPVGVSSTVRLAGVEKSSLVTTAAGHQMAQPVPRHSAQLVAATKHQTVTPRHLTRATQPPQRVLIRSKSHPMGPRHR